jgi:hypothetical protein
MESWCVRVMIGAVGVGLMGSRDASAAARPLVVRDNFADTWAATDGLGRKLPTGAEVGRPRGDRFVGMFYFLWLGAHAGGEGPFDVGRILANDPDAAKKDSTPPWGPVGTYHHWGEPLFGYYRSDDSWVLRKHARMLADAGVDTLIFDASNGHTYKGEYTALLKAFGEVRKEGGRTPQVAFLVPFWDPTASANKLYEDLYAKGLHEDLWFRWDGRPLLLADPDKVDPKLREFFTLRRPQPSYFDGPGKPDMWSWLEVYPQHVFTNSRGEKEQMSVGVGQNAVGDRLGSMSEPGARGRSFHGGRRDERPGAVNWGLNVQEQWDRALSEDPKFVFVTGWNEWIAGRHNSFGGISTPPMFVDLYDQEHSRDIEPMKGGHGDNYYYQLVANVRRFKGVRPVPAASAAKTIDLAGAYDQWADVGPEYVDDAGDVGHRDHPGYNGATRYVDTSGRNDLTSMKVARDEKNVYFYAATADPMTSHTDPNWMVLFINADRDAATGWEGYDFAVNLRVQGADTSVLQFTRNGWNWVPRATVRMRQEGNQLMIAVPRDLLGIDGTRPVEFEFKWADNFGADDDINGFTTSGDAAPPGRFNYVYRESRP